MLLTTIIILAATFLVADFHAQWYKANKPIKWWWHPLWVSPFVLFAVLDGIDHHNTWYGLLIFCPHGLFFAQLLNWLRKKGFFYISTSGPNPSLTDTILLKIKAVYPYLWSVLAVSYITILILVLINIIHL